ncbi:sugar ABC transporter ATP-binding protein [Vibrio salinus]|uniref:sugar ABC transporter ATP-binding protein n=1 Tax=Vibrio salinus TaxID=2899784 RepID=UPI001E539B20|nr:sugar ABC transporter ATP-binding protein [Vibrio salinus]MCE0495990.1 sugar ABC transporter ATP-binding protein [Vibrio salinus]
MLYSTTDTKPTYPGHSGSVMGLKLNNIGKKFGKTRVLQGITLDVRPGEVLALLGENGAGKSTLSNIISGVITSSEGDMLWKGEPYSPLTPSEGLESGIRLIHQEIRLLPDLSIAENIFVGKQPMKGGLLDTDTMYEKTMEQLERLGLHVPPNTLVRELSIAAQQQVEIAKALAHHAELLILDEPTAALGGEEVERLFEQIEQLKMQGVGFIYISHRLDEIAKIADRIAVIRDGNLISVHDSGIVPVKELVSEMVGRNVERMFPPLPEPQNKEVLRVESLTSKLGKFRDISFSVNEGEIFGISGIVGAGRSELVRAIFGADPIESGDIYIDGSKVNITHPKKAIDAGLVLVPEDRKQQGLIVEQSIGDNVLYGNFDLLDKHGWAFPSVCMKYSREAIQKVRTKGQTEDAISSLSGGNQQKVLIGKWIARSPKIFILDEPTRGIDVGARAAIYEVISDLAKIGMAVVVVSSDLDEVIGLSNRVMVLAHGENQGILNAEDANQISIMELATQ